LNHIAIEGGDIPTDRAANKTATLAMPLERGGVLVEFLAPRLRVVRATLRVHDGERWIAPRYGEIVIGSQPSMNDPESEFFKAPLGEDGELEIDGLGPGPHHAEIQWQGGRRSCNFFVPAASGALVDVGELHCEETH